MPADRFSTATRIRALGTQAAERVYRAQRRRVRAPHRSRLTGRAALLALVVCSLVVALAYPLRQYVSQRAEIGDLQRQEELHRDRVQELRRLTARWQDPAFVQQRARERLGFLLPGETGYVMRDGSAEASRPSDGGGAGGPWHRNLWEGVDKADRSGTDARGGTGRTLPADGTAPGG